MGAKVLVKWTSRVPTTEQQAYEPLCKAAESLRGAKRQQHSVECTVTEPSQTVGNAGKVRQILTQIRFSDNPEHVYLALESAGQVVAASSTMTGKGGLMERLGFQASAGGIKRGVRFDGVKYVSGDFALFVAQASSTTGSKEFMGVVAEVEYKPLQSIKKAQPILEDFIAVLKDALRRSEACPEGALQVLPMVHHLYRVPQFRPIEHESLPTYPQKNSKITNVCSGPMVHKGPFLWLQILAIAAIYPSHAATSRHSLREDQHNLRPLIGILTEPGSPAPKGHSYIAASYVKFVEASGGRAVPIEYDLSETEVEERMKVINGVLIPGGGADLSPHHPFYDTAAQLLELTLAANDAGDYFPLHGTCLGFEALSVILSKNTSVLSTFDSGDNASPLILTAEAHSSRFLNSFPPDVLANLQSQPLAMENHHFGITYDTYIQNSGLQDFFTITSLSLDRKGAAYVSSMESRKYPVTATQWHPEKNAFEWATSLHIPHSPEAVEVTHAVGNFLLNEARRNSHAPADISQENELLIYNYPLVFTAKTSHKGLETGFDECFFFPDKNGRPRV